MVATSILKSWELAPNCELKSVLFTTPNTADATNTLEITLADYGISATGLLVVESWVHTADGSVITTELNTCAVSAGVLTVTIAAGTDNDSRVVQVIGRADLGVFAQMVAATSILKQWEVVPNAGLKVLYFQTPNTADENNTFTVTLADYGINVTGLLTIRSWVHTTSGSIIVTDIATCSVTAGVATITVQSANTDCVRVVELMGRADIGVFA